MALALLCSSTPVDPHPMHHSNDRRPWFADSCSTRSALAALSLAALSLIGCVDAGGNQPIAAAGAAPAGGGGAANGGGPAVSGGAGEAGGAASKPALPLHTQGRFIVGADGKRVKLAGVSWYGGEAPDLVPDGLQKNALEDIARLTAELGFNAVRLPWSNELYERNPVVDASHLSKNPALQGLTALEILDKVVEALTARGLLVILDNHRSRADWCCDTAHGDGLWYTAEYPEAQWLADWQGMVERYRQNPAVVGADLRNELRGQLAADAPSTCTDCDTPTADCVCEWASWGDTTGNNRDWAAAAERAGNAIHEVNPDLLIMVEGPHWSSWLGATYRPIALAVPNKVVYSPHNYQSMGGFEDDCVAYQAKLESQWGQVATKGIAPLWIGEFGVNRNDPENAWWACLREYLSAADLDWSYWALNGTQGPGYGRTAGAAELFGVLNEEWSAAASAEHLAALQALAPATLSP